MNLEHFEQQARAAFDQFRPESDHQQIWENIEPHLKKKKRRPFLLLFWGMGLFFLLFFCWRHNSPKPPGLAENMVSESKTLAPTAPVTHEKSGIKVKPAAEFENSDTRRENNKRQVAAQPSNLPAPERRAFQKHPESASRRLETTFAPLSGVQNLVTQNLELQASEVSKSLMENEPVVVPVPGLPAVLAATNSNEKGTQEKAERHPSKAKKPARIKPKRRTRVKQILSLHVGPLLPIRVLQTNDAVEPIADLLSNRRASEKMLEAFSGALHYTYAGKKGLLLRGGLEFIRLNEKFEVSYEEKETQIVTGVLTQTVDGTGQVIAQTTGPKQVTTTRIYSNTAYNRYQFLNVPIGLGFQRLNKRSQWELAGGLDINLFFNFKGTIYNAYGSATPLSNPSYLGVYKKNVGLGAWASYGYSRNLSRNIRWQLLAKTRVPFQAITSEKYPLVQKYFTVGLQGGLLFNLSKAPKSKHKKQR